MQIHLKKSNHKQNIISKKIRKLYWTIQNIQSQLNKLKWSTLTKKTKFAHTFFNLCIQLQLHQPIFMTLRFFALSAKSSGGLIISNKVDIIIAESINPILGTSFCNQYYRVETYAYLIALITIYSVTKYYFVEMKIEIIITSCSTSIIRSITKFRIIHIYTRYTY